MVTLLPRQKLFVVRFKVTADAVRRFGKFTGMDKIVL